MDSVMTSAEGFWEALRQSPDADDLRLVFADWLEEQGDPHGELMRVQVELATARQRTKKRRELVKRQQQLHDEHADQLLGCLPDRAESWQFVRGLLHVKANAEKLLAPVESGIEVFGWIEKLELTGGLTNAQLLRGFPHLTHLVELDLSDGGAGAGRVVDMLEVPCLDGLRRLHLSSTGFNDDNAATLAGAPRLTHLTHLWLDNNQIGPDGATVLANSPHLASLTHLCLWTNHLGEEGARAIIRSPYWTKLVELNLGANRVGDDVVRELAVTPQLSGLTALRIWDNQLTDKALFALARSPVLTLLETLYLNYNHFTDAGVEALLRSPNVAHLRCLWLNEMEAPGMGFRSIHAVAMSPYLTNLTELNLMGCVVNDASAIDLATTRNLPALTKLHLDSQGLSARVMKRLRLRFGEGGVTGAD
jgi:uncharacterized protein (TIGR02996 family)